MGPRRTSSHVQTGREDHVPPDHLSRRLHLCIQARVTDQSRRTHDLPTRLIQPRDNPHNRPFHDVRQVRDFAKTHAVGPVVHHLYQPKSWSTDKIVRIVTAQYHLVQDLVMIDFLRDLHNRLDPLLEMLR
jgi:hypothetical protein